MQARHFIFSALLAGLSASPALWADNLDPDPSPPRIMSQAQGMQVYTLPDGRVHAEINYQQQGNAAPADDTQHKFTFEGTQAEVREQIQQNTGLPDDKKQALLQALGGNPAAMFGQPVFGGGDPFDDPFFKNDPLMEDFFKHSPFDDDFLQKFFSGMPSFDPPPGFGSGQGLPQIQPPLSAPPMPVIPPVTPPAHEHPAPAEGGKGILL
jgi:hypothetical protein